MKVSWGEGDPSAAARYSAHNGEGGPHALSFALAEEACKKEGFEQINRLLG
jgi:hypothetical protein